MLRGGTRHWENILGNEELCMRACHPSSAIAMTTNVIGPCLNNGICFYHSFPYEFRTSMKILSYSPSTQLLRINTGRRKLHHM